MIFNCKISGMQRMLDARNSLTLRYTLHHFLWQSQRIVSSCLRRIPHFGTWQLSSHRVDPSCRSEEWETCNGMHKSYIYLFAYISMCLHATKDEINAPASESIQPLLGCKGRNCSKVQVNQNHLDTIQTLQKVKACIRAVSKTNVHQMGHAQALAS